MPVGPSHNRGRSSGSSFSSSRSSSSSYRSSSSSSRSYSSGGHYHRHSHTTYYSGVEIEMSPRGWAIFGLVWGFLFVIIFALIGADMIANNLPYRSLMRRDAVEYQQIIDKANNGEDGYYKITIEGIRNTGSSTHGENPTEFSLSSNSNRFYATAYSEVKRSGVYYYYLDFGFTDDAGNRITGTTYSYYAEAAVMSMSSIDLIYTKKYDGDGSWDIIQSNYMLSKNMDYWYTGKQVVTGAIFAAVALGLGVLFVWCSVKVHKSRKEEKAMSGAGASATNEIKYKSCRYCGCQVRYENDRCSACGSREFR